MAWHASRANCYHWHFFATFEKAKRLHMVQTYIKAVSKLVAACAGTGSRHSQISWPVSRAITGMSALF
eukprot:3640786-Pleurochrysis_carterae.AAC.1